MHLMRACIHMCVFEYATAFLICVWKRYMRDFPSLTTYEPHVTYRHDFFIVCITKLSSFFYSLQISVSYSFLIVGIAATTTVNLRVRSNSVTGAEVRRGPARGKETPRRNLPRGQWNHQNIQVTRPSKTKHRRRVRAPATGLHLGRPPEGTSSSRMLCVELRRSVVDRQAGIGRKAVAYGT